MMHGQKNIKLSGEVVRRTGCLYHVTE